MTAPSIKELAERINKRVHAREVSIQAGYYWLPCPRCGEWMSGMERRADSVKCLFHPMAAHHACCQAGDEQIEANACRRAHEAVGEAIEVEEDHDANAKNAWQDWDDEDIKTEFKK